MIAPGLSPPEPTTSRVRLGYGIAMAVSTLVLISAILVASYSCLRLRIRAGPTWPAPPPLTPVTARPHQVVPYYPARSWPKCAGPTCGPPGAKAGAGGSKTLPRPNSGPCSICLADYKAKETIRCMPDCNHCFHATCIDPWLRMSPTCPLCRSSPAPVRLCRT